jgi:hypothetical protein
MRESEALRALDRTWRRESQWTAIGYRPGLEAGGQRSLGAHALEPFPPRVLEYHHVAAAVRSRVRETGEDQSREEHHEGQQPQHDQDEVLHPSHLHRGAGTRQRSRYGLSCLLDGHRSVRDSVDDLRVR